MGLEYDPETGLLAYREVIATVPRQKGKTTLVLCWELDRCVMWDRPQRAVYSAQTGWDARRKLIDDQVPLIEGSRSISKTVKRVLRGTGNESVTFKTGSRIDIIAADKGAGHGRTIDLGVVDEAFDDVDDRREGALLPAMTTRASAQILVSSTAGTLDSLYLRRKVEMGRKAATEGRTDGIAYFEWSVPDTESIDDEDVWWEYVPALNDITLASMRHARETMTEGEFRRAFLNQWTGAGTIWISMDVWDRGSEEPDIPEGSPVYLGIDGAAKRDTTAIATDRRDDDSNHHVKVEVFAARNENEVIDPERVKTRLREIANRYEIIQASYDPHLFWPIAQELLEEGIPMVEVQQNVSNKKLYSQALFDVAMQQRIRHGGDPVLRAHAEAAVAKDRGDGWTLEKIPSVTKRPNDAIIAVAMAVQAAELEADGGEVSVEWF